MHADPLHPDAVYAYRPARGRRRGVDEPRHAFDAEGHALLRALYAHHREDPHLRAIAGVLVLLLHVLLAWWLFVASRPYPIEVTQPPTQALIVRLIPSPKPIPPPPAIVLPPPLAAPPPAPHVPPRPAPPPARPAPAAAPNPASTPAGTLRLYSPGGTLILPRNTAPPPVAAFAPQLPRANADINPRQVVAPAKHTAFSQYWVPKNESLLDRYVRKTLQTATLPVRLPGNTRAKCVILPFPPGGACGIAGPDQLSHFTPPANALSIQTLPEHPLVPATDAPARAGSDTPAPAASVPPPH